MFKPSSVFGCLGISATGSLAERKVLGAPCWQKRRFPLDVRVVSLPDPRFGRKVAVVVQADGEAEGLREALDAYARAGLAGYKIPRRYILTDQSLRLNNGKPYYKAAQALANAAESGSRVRRSRRTTNPQRR